MIDNPIAHFDKAYSKKLSCHKYPLDITELEYVHIRQDF